MNQHMLERDVVRARRPGRGVHRPRRGARDDDLDGLGTRVRPTRWLAGIGFSLGLILVVIAGAELFTGNNLILMSWVSRRITAARLLRNWTIVYAGNLVGAVSIAVMVYLAG